MLDGWLGDAPEQGRRGAIEFRAGDGGTLGTIAVALDGARDRGAALAEASRRLHDELYRFLDERGQHLVRAWTQLPDGAEREPFERGRADAYRARSCGAPLDGRGPADVVTFGGGAELRVEFFAGAARPLHLPGASVYDHAGRRFLITGAITGAGAALGEEVRAAIQRLRELTGLQNLEPHGLDFGFRLEDLLELRVHHGAVDRAEHERQLRRHVAPDCRLDFTRAAPGGGASFAFESVLQKRSGESRRPIYRRENGRVRVEAFELHVVEHCNLRCAHCCNMSPYLDRHFMSVEEVDAQCRRMAAHVKADVFKIMGGEPLLHPQITEILIALRATGISDVIRLFTNGLLLARMPDDFWRALDHLTVSDYSSAPVRADHLALIREKARAFDVILNVKPVDRFNRVMSRERAADGAAIQATYDECWLRHRCLIVRGGAFFKCTRAAYFKEFQERLDLPEPDRDAARTRDGDGVPLDAPDFAERLVAYLNDARPLGACRYCHGSSGPLEPHTQLTRLDVRRGRL